MSRRQAEWLVVGHKFPELTEKAFDLIYRTTTKNECGDTDDHVIDALWAKLSSNFSPINDEASAPSERSQELAATGTLTQEGRMAIRERLDKALAYHAAVAEMSADDLEELWQAALREDRDETPEERAARGRENDRFGPLNTPSAQVDMAFWIQKKVWTEEQAVALSLEKNPDFATAEKLKPYRKVRVSNYAEKFGRRMEMVEHAIQLQKVRKPIQPQTFMMWAMSEGIGEHFAKWLPATTESDEDRLDARIQHTLYRMILGAARKYGFDLKQMDLDQQDGPIGAFLADIKEATRELSLQTFLKHLEAAQDWAIEEMLILRGAAEPAVMMRRKRRRNISK